MSTKTRSKKTSTKNQNTSTPNFTRTVDAEHESPTPARDAFGAALEAAAPKAHEAYALARERVAAPLRAATATMSKKGKAVAWFVGLCMAASMASFGVNSVARPGIAAVARTALGPSYRIQCQLPSGNFGVCSGQRGGGK